MSVGSGILWATFTFAGVLGLNRSFVPEKEQGCLEGLMVCPASREAISAKKEAPDKSGLAARLVSN